MSTPAWVGVILSGMAVIVFPSFALTVRATIRWARVEGQLNALAGDIKELVENKDKVHQEIITTIREDRAATDKRLRWLEEHLWNGGNRAVRNQGSR